MKKKRSKWTLFDYVNTALITLLCLSIILPFISVFFTSLSSSAAASMGSFDVDWDNLTLKNYRATFKNQFILRRYVVTILRTVITTVLSLLLTSIGAYCLSKKWFPHRGFWMGIVVFTMFFSGGLIPTYLTYVSYGLKNSFWAMVLPGLCSAYNLIIMRNFFQQIPESIEESGRLDGAGELRILLSLIYPISKPVLATVAMWVAVSNWNAWFDCLVYIRDTDKFVLQVVLRRIVLQGSSQMMELAGNNPNLDLASNPDGLKAASIFVATVPILLVYPFAQKYFVKGVIVGSLKG